MKRVNRLAARAFIDGRKFAKGGTVVLFRRGLVLLTNQDRVLAQRPQGDVTETIIHWETSNPTEDAHRLLGLVNELNEDGHNLVSGVVSLVDTIAEGDEAPSFTARLFSYQDQQETNQ